MILLIDNYDSFTFNLYDYICQSRKSVMVIKNDQLNLAQIKKLTFSKIVLSPGAGNPNNAGISLDVVKTFCHTHPILGVCLGHQIIAQHYGYTISKAPEPMHGKVDMIWHDGKGVFEHLPDPLSVVRYHSLIVNHNDQGELQVSARNRQGLIMAMRHKTLPIESVQFHPEAIKTQSGLQLITNFINKRY